MQLLLHHQIRLILVKCCLVGKSIRLYVLLLGAGQFRYSVLYTVFVQTVQAHSYQSLKNGRNCLEIHFQRPHAKADFASRPLKDGNGPRPVMLTIFCTNIYLNFDEFGLCFVFLSSGFKVNPLISSPLFLFGIWIYILNVF